MVYNTILSAALFFLLIGSGCRSTQVFPQDYKGEQLHFGQGGGFTGAVTSFVLLDDGRLFQKEYKDSTYSQLEKWPIEFVNQMFLNYHLLHLDQVNHYEPGDLYYFIEYHSEENEMHRIGWGKPGFIPDENVVLFYNLLYKSTKSKS
jgi:hypothetical protein